MRSNRQPLRDPGFEVAAAGLQWFSDALHLPFDVLRTQHAEAVHAGLMANSILESRDFERTVDALEHIALGPFARNV
jgi:hypothetical protein